MSRHIAQVKSSSSISLLSKSSTFLSVKTGMVFILNQIDFGDKLSQSVIHLTRSRKIGVDFHQPWLLGLVFDKFTLVVFFKADTLKFIDFLYFLSSEIIRFRFFIFKNSCLFVYFDS